MLLLQLICKFEIIEKLKKCKIGKLDSPQINELSCIWFWKEDRFHEDSGSQATASTASPEEDRLLSQSQQIPGVNVLQSRWVMFNSVMYFCNTDQPGDAMKEMIFSEMTNNKIKRSQDYLFLTSTHPVKTPLRLSLGFKWTLNWGSLYCMFLFRGLHKDLLL